MSFVIDSSVPLTWLLPDEAREDLRLPLASVERQLIQVATSLGVSVL